MSVRWFTSLKTAPAQEPITLQEARNHLRVEGVDEDAQIAALITAAREYVENATARALLTQTWYLKLSGFPCGNIVLPKPPLVSVAAITYVDSNGTTQTWSSSLYRVIAPAGPKARHGQVELVYGQTYPSAREQEDAVTVEYLCGYASRSLVPQSLKAAMLLLIGHWFEHREPVIVGNIVTPVPTSVDALLGSYAAEV